MEAKILLGDVYCLVLSFNFFLFNFLYSKILISFPLKTLTEQLHAEVYFVKEKFTFLSILVFRYNYLKHILLPLSSIKDRLT